MKYKKLMRTGFTLVELLIVIALIAILSVAVLATINPIEQTNKARDAKFKNDAAEVLNALERYYASQNEYPWNNIDIGGSVAANSKIAVGGTSPLFGVRGLGDSNGVLITTSELKSAFKGKDSFQTSPDNNDMMYVYHNGSDSNYVCFVPKANANRTGAVAATLKCMNLASGSDAAIYDLDDSAASGNCDAMTNWTVTGNLLPSQNLANLLCVPEGDVN